MNRGVVNSPRSLGVGQIHRIADLLAPIATRIAAELASLIRTGQVFPRSFDTPQLPPVSCPGAAQADGEAS